MYDLIFWKCGSLLIEQGSYDTGHHGSSFHGSSCHATWTQSCVLHSTSSLKVWHLSLPCLQKGRCFKCIRKCAPAYQTKPKVITKNRKLLQGTFSVMWICDSVCIQDDYTLANGTEDLPLVLYGFWGAYTGWAMQSDSYASEYKWKCIERRGWPEGSLRKQMFDPNKKDNRQITSPSWDGDQIALKSCESAFASVLETLWRNLKILHGNISQSI